MHRGLRHTPAVPVRETVLAGAAAGSWHPMIPATAGAAGLAVAATAQQLERQMPGLLSAAAELPETLPASPVSFGAVAGAPELCMCSSACQQGMLHCNPCSATDHGYTAQHTADGLKQTRRTSKCTCTCTAAWCCSAALFASSLKRPSAAASWSCACC